MATSPDYYDDVREVLKELEAQTDRGAAIVGAALLDAKLAKSLRHSMVPLTETEDKQLFVDVQAPLLGYSIKVHVAYAFGLFDAISRKDFQTIGRIRNLFAHYLDKKSFDDPDIASLCGKLYTANVVHMGEQRPTEPRQQYIRAVINLMHFLYTEIVSGTPPGKPPRVQLAMDKVERFVGSNDVPNSAESV